jgi:regulator of nucleoside diphosphate kinase
MHRHSQALGALKTIIMAKKLTKADKAQRQANQLEQRADTRLAEGGARVTPSECIPRDVIRMNSRIRILDLDKQKKHLYTLVFPERADISRDLISVLVRVGIALLGCRQGDVIETRVPGGTRRLRVERVLYSPEMPRQRVRPDRSNRRELYSCRTLQRTTLAA